MAGRGPTPKPETERRRRNAPAKPKTTVAATPAKKTTAKKTAPAKPTMRGPALPAGHSAKTKTWYDTWRRSPQAAAFADSDWQRLQMLAHLVDSFFNRVTNAQVQKQLLGEIRLNEASLGATVGDRLRMNLEIKPADEPTAAQPSSPAKKATAGRKSRLLKVVGGTEA